MARTTVTHILDDLDGSKDASEVSFSYGGVDYTIDLNKKNQAAFDKAIKPYLDAATKVSKRSSGRRSASSSLTRDFSAIREWAKAEGIKVSDRGRVPKNVIEQYNASH